MDNEVTFLGRGWAFPPAFKRYGAVDMVSAGDDIAQSLAILLATTPGERVMQPDFGCALRWQTFENFNQSSVTALQDEIRRAILFFEPRIILESVIIDQSRYEQGYLDLLLQYLIIRTNTRSNLVYPFYFREATDA